MKTRNHIQVTRSLTQLITQNPIINAIPKMKTYMHDKGSWIIYIKIHNYMEYS